MMIGQLDCEKMHLIRLLSIWRLCYLVGNPTLGLEEKFCQVAFLRSLENIVSHSESSRGVFSLFGE